MIRPQSRIAAIGVALAALAAPLGAQNGVVQQGWNSQQILRTETFVKPPADVEKMITTPRTDISFTNPSPDRKWFLRAPAADRGDIDAYGKAHINLGGLQIDTRANRARTVTTSTRFGLTLIDPRTMTTKSIETPKGATLWAQTWSPTGTQIAYIASFDDASQIYVADVATGKSVQITKTPLNATLVTSLDWTADGKSIVTVLVPDGRGAAPIHGKPNGVEDGPEVRLTESRALPQVIHPSLLEDPHDKAQLVYYTTGQLAIVDVKSKAVKKIGTPTMIRAVDASPDGQYFRVTRMVEPFSYIVPVAQFGSVQELWDATGKVVATLNKTPLREGGRGSDDPDAAPAGRGAQQSSPSDTGKRNVQWNPVGPGSCICSRYLLLPRTVPLRPRTVPLRPLAAAVVAVVRVVGRCHPRNVNLPVCAMKAGCRRTVRTTRRCCMRAPADSRALRTAAAAKRCSSPTAAYSPFVLLIRRRSSVSAPP